MEHPFLYVKRRFDSRYVTGAAKNTERIALLRLALDDSRALPGGVTREQCVNIGVGAAAGPDRAAEQLFKAATALCPPPQES